MAMKFSEDGASFLKSIEGFMAKAYVDADTISIGYGTSKRVRPEIKMGMVIDEATASAWMMAFIIRGVEPTLNKNVKVALTQNQFDALVSFIYNVGPGAFEGSTMLKLINNGRFLDAAGQFMRWIYAGTDEKTSQPIINAGLKARRVKEFALFTKK